MLKLKWDWRFPSWQILQRNEPLRWMFGFFSMAMVGLIVILLLIMVGMRIPWSFDTYGALVVGWLIAFVGWNFATVCALLIVTAQRCNVYSWRKLWLFYSGTPVPIMVGVTRDMPVQERMQLIANSFSHCNVSFQSGQDAAVFRYRADAVRYRLMVH